MSNLTVREIRSSDERDILEAEFRAKIEGCTATKEDVVGYVLTICYNESLGMRWIHAHPEEFGGVVGDVDQFMNWVCEISEIDPEAQTDLNVNAWSGNHMLCYWFIQSFIMSAKTLSLLSLTWRERYVFELYPRFGANNHGWIGNALVSGVSRDIIVYAIIERLRRTKVVEGSVNAIHDFLISGDGDQYDLLTALLSLGVDRKTADTWLPQLGIDPLPALVEIESRLRQGIQPNLTRFPDLKPWAVLSNQELADALLICAEKAPGKTLSTLLWSSVKPRLNLDAVDKIVTCARQNMRSLKDVSVETLERLLTLSGRERLARGLNPVSETRPYLHKATAQFLFRIVVELPQGQREKFWMDVVPYVLKDVRASVLYPAWRQLKLEEHDVETTLLNWLDRENYLVGTIVQGTHPKGGIQMMVEVDGHRYVQDRYAHRYYPNKGDLVLFPRTGMSLTPYVTSVAFVPVMKDID